MKSLYFFSTICLWCTGCATYQYATISSPLKDEKSNTFVVENDTAKIMYDFSGEKGPVKISIYNKLKVPLYIDWAKSALIAADVRKSYSNKNASLDAELNGTETRWMNSSSQTATIRGTITSGEVSEFIPPRAWAKESPLKLSADFFQLPSQAGNTKHTNGAITKSVTYSREHSPLSFRSYLTLSTHPDFSVPIHFDHEFWISEITQTQSTPKNFPIQANRFYIKKTNKTGPYVAGAAVGVAALVFVVSQQESEKAFQD